MVLQEGVAMKESFAREGELVHGGVLGDDLGGGRGGGL